MSATPSLIEKYNIPGPRYTSYPTVPAWTESPTEEQWMKSIDEALDDAEQKGIGAAIYVHVPFCESLCTYCGCNTRITRNRTVGKPYVESVLKEWKYYLDRLKRPIKISEIHLGGGTPTFLTPDELKYLISGLLENVSVAQTHEFSLEADPRVTTSEHLRMLRSLGFNRLSLGIQDFDPAVQDIVHRIQSVEQVRKLTEEARDLGFSGINYDLIYGLPLQTLKSIDQTIAAVRELRPDRIAFYGYAHVPWIKPAQRRFTDNDVPYGNEKRALYELGRLRLEEAGFLEIGLDHFSLPSDSLWKAMESGTLHRNFMGYTVRQVAPLFGLGVSAIGDSWTVFAQNEKVLETYQGKLEKGELPLHRGHVLNREDLVLRRHILNIMTQKKTSWEGAEAQVPFLETLPARLAPMVDDRLVDLTSHSCEVTTAGRPFLRNVCMAFDARLNVGAGSPQRFSRTI